MNALVRGITGVAVVVLTAASLSSQENRALAHRFVAVSKDATSLSGRGSIQLKDGRTLFGGDVKLPGTHLYEWGKWLACVTADGQVQWSVRAEERADAASLFPLASDGDSIWIIGVTKNRAQRRRPRV